MRRQAALILVAAVALAACAAPSPRSAVPPAETADDGLAWARGKIWYQVFPERFRNGDPSNDPTVADVPETDGKHRWHLSPWTSDWYEEQPWEVKRSTDFYHMGVVFARRYGGDIQGVIDKLDYLKDLGVDVIYLTPVFEAPSLHKYDASSLHHVDLHFGPDPAGDRQLLAEARETEDPDTWIWTKSDILFLRLIREAHGRGIRVVIDGVFNHTGRQFFAFRDLLKKGKKSRYADWYMVTKWGEKPGDEFEYKAWWDVRSLPILARDSQGLLPGPRKYVFAITKRWLAPNGSAKDGVDGFRLDVIEEVPAPFWKEWRAHVRSIKPQALTVGEIWGDASGWVKDGRIDSTMNYQFAQAAVGFFVDRKTAVSGSAFAARLKTLLDSYAPQKAQLLLNLMDSHDTDRLASMIVNPDRPYGQRHSPRSNPDYDVRKPGAEALQVQKQVAAFQMAFLGAPMVYYGDEAGMWGATDPDDRKPMLWPELVYAPESRHPLGKPRPADPVRFDTGLWGFYRSLMRVRHESPALSGGDLRFLKAALSQSTVGFSRRAGESEALALFNRADQVHRLSLPVAHAGYRDALGNKTLASAKGRLRVEVPAHGFLILLSQPGP
ncbi:MAG: glycoside hydrolase family 13 protein [Elusimicrobia bacterium]|nr:glycoside hydrolase family 13 protein [Elusimicrobiota bacterium]